MCGIFGVSGVPDAARLTYMGLYALQHRGQESAVIVAIDEHGRARAHRGMGTGLGELPSTRLQRCLGRCRRRAHPVLHRGKLGAGQRPAPARSTIAGGPLTIAHNGNLTNAPELRRELADQGAIFTTTTTPKSCCI
jgi:amidophosphoribosyltransferase